MLTQSIISENKVAAARRGENQYTNHPKTFILQRTEVAQTGEEASVEYEKHSRSSLLLQEVQELVIR